MALYQAMRGLGPLSVVYGNVNYTAMFGVGYSVDEVTEIHTRLNVRLISALLDYANGASVRVRFRMTPHALI